MSSRPQLKPQPVLNSTTGQSMAGNLTSLVTVISNITRVSYGVSWSGTSPVGTLSVQGSNDYQQNADGSVENAGTWTTLTLESNGSSTTTIPVSGNTGAGMIDVQNTAIYALRLIYTSASGTGTLSATICGKVS